MSDSNKCLKKEKEKHMTWGELAEYIRIMNLKVSVQKEDYNYNIAEKGN